MKKYTRIAYIVLILIILLSGFFIYKVSEKNSSDEDLKNKTFSEVKFLESQFLNLFNEINNIKFDNYTISSTEIKSEEMGISSSEQSSSSGSNSKENSNRFRKF